MECIQAPSSVFSYLEVQYVVLTGSTLCTKALRRTVHLQIFFFFCQS